MNLGPLPKARNITNVDKELRDLSDTVNYLRKNEERVERMYARLERRFKSTSKSNPPKWWICDTAEAINKAKKAADEIEETMTALLWHNDNFEAYTKGLKILGEELCERFSLEG